MKLIPKKYVPYVSPFFIALLMSVLMSGYVTYVNLGFSDGFIYNWHNAWRHAFLVALPVTYFVVPVVKSIFDEVSY